MLKVAPVMLLGLELAVAGALGQVLGLGGDLAERLHVGVCG